MRISSSIPFHIAKAYGLTAPSKPKQVMPIAAPGSTPEVAAPTPAAIGSGLQQLIGGSVREGVEFDSASTPARPAGPTLQLYTRAADRIEAATGVHLGRGLDIKG